jgi:hypothetical protein
MDCEAGHSAVSQIRQDATASDVKQAFRRLALLRHPDKIPGDPKAKACFTLSLIAFINGFNATYLHITHFVATCTMCVGVGLGMA